MHAKMVINYAKNFLFGCIFCAENGIVAGPRSLLMENMYLLTATLGLTKAQFTKN